MATITQRGLGKGLSALLSENYTTDEIQKAPKASSPKKSDASDSPPPKKTGVAIVQSAAGGVYSLPIHQLSSGKYQPRGHFDPKAIDELAHSIRAHGIMQPIVVRPIAEKKDAYEIVAGERRWRAASAAGLGDVPVIIRDLSDKQALELALIENIQRQDLNPLDEATGYQRLMEEFEHTQEALGSIMGKSRSHVANMLRLLSLPEDIQTLLREDKISMGHARALIGAKDASAIAHMIIEKNLSVRQTESLVKKPQHPQKSQAPFQRSTAKSYSTEQPAGSTQKDGDIVALEESLSESLGLRVSINDRGQNGEIIISYDSLSQLDAILRRLGDSL